MSEQRENKRLEEEKRLIANLNRDASLAIAQARREGMLEAAKIAEQDCEIRPGFAPSWGPESFVDTPQGKRIAAAIRRAAEKGISTENKP